MRRLALFLIVGAALLLPARAIEASPITFVATLAGASESPPTGSPGTGHATVVLDPVANTLHVDVTFSGLEAGTTMSHIHCCLPSPEVPGVNVGVATTTPTFPGFPLGVTAGTYSHDFSLLDPATYNPAFVTLEGGTILAARNALVAGIGAGETYLNIHTTLFPSGEIRGFLVPEAATLLLLSAGLAGLAGVASRRRRQR
jgi:CHRD domain-containing protein/PEP-CTERM motif-containing protein